MERESEEPPPWLAKEASYTPSIPDSVDTQYRLSAGVHVPTSERRMQMHDAGLPYSTYNPHRISCPPAADHAAPKQEWQALSEHTRQVLPTFITLEAVWMEHHTSEHHLYRPRV